MDPQGAAAATAQDHRARHGFEREPDVRRAGGHPLFVFNQFGDVERCALRPGNVHSAADWRSVLEPVITRYRRIVKRLYFRGDAAFANPEMYEFLEAEGAGYTMRLPATPMRFSR